MWCQICKTKEKGNEGGENKGKKSEMKLKDE